MSLRQKWKTVTILETNLLHRNSMVKLFETFEPSVKWLRLTTSFKFSRLRELIICKLGGRTSNELFKNCLSLESITYTKFAELIWPPGRVSENDIQSLLAIVNRQKNLKNLNIPRDFFKCFPIDEFPSGLKKLHIGSLWGCSDFEYLDPFVMKQNQLVKLSLDRSLSKNIRMLRCVLEISTLKELTLDSIGLLGKTDLPINRSIEVLNISFYDHKSRKV